MCIRDRHQTDEQRRPRLDGQPRGRGEQPEQEEQTPLGDRPERVDEPVDRGPVRQPHVPEHESSEVCRDEPRRVNCRGHGIPEHRHRDDADSEDARGSSREQAHALAAEPADGDPDDGSDAEFDQRQQGQLPGWVGRVVLDQLQGESGRDDDDGRVVEARLCLLYTSRCV